MRSTTDLKMATCNQIDLYVLGKIDHKEIVEPMSCYSTKPADLVSTRISETHLLFISTQDSLVGMPRYSMIYAHNSIIFFLISNKESLILANFEMTDQTDRQTRQTDRQGRGRHQRH